MDIKLPIGENDGEYTPDYKFAHWKPAKCLECGKETRLYDGAMFFDGIPTPLCSDACMEKHWRVISYNCNKPDDIPMVN